MMRRVLHICAALALPLGCTSYPEGYAPANIDADGVGYRVYYEPDVFFARPVTVTDEQGRLVEIEPFPLTSGMVVIRRDGADLEHADYERAQAVAEAYCAQRGRAWPGDIARRNTDDVYIWLFRGCAAHEAIPESR